MFSKHNLYNLFCCIICSPLVFFSMKADATGNSQYYFFLTLILPLIVTKYLYVIVGMIFTLPVSTFLAVQFLGEHEDYFIPYGTMYTALLIAIVTFGFQSILYIFKTFIIIEWNDYKQSQE